MLSIPLILITPPLLVMILFPLILHYNTFFWIISWVVSCLQNCLFPVHNWVITLQWYEILNMCLLNVSKLWEIKHFLPRIEFEYITEAARTVVSCQNIFKQSSLIDERKIHQKIILQILIISSCHGHVMPDWLMLSCTFLLLKIIILVNLILLWHAEQETVNIWYLVRLATAARV